MFVLFALITCIIQSSNGISSPITPFATYDHSVELLANVSDLWWTVNEGNQSILFELHTHTTGWIALGISPAGGMYGADIGVGWVDQNGKVYFQDRHAIGEFLPMIDNTTIDWFALQGREQNGWTAIQFTRALDTCDSMDVPIESGTDYLIFAYGLVDPSLCPPVSDITYHADRKGSYILSLRSYNDPPLQSQFAQLDRLEFRITNYVIPPVETTYHCKVYKVPANYTTKRQVVAHEILINSTNPAIVHHLLMYECDSTVQFNDSNLPDDICDNIYDQLNGCTINIATGWAVGSQLLTAFPPEAGYPIGGNFPTKYYMIQMHYNNPQLTTNNTDNSGIRFYITDQLRQYDIGYLTFGTTPDVYSLVIPPQVENFAVDSYCSMAASAAFPATGIKVLTAFPHTHLQGISIWTKLIRNKTAVEYLFDATSYNFNYQFENKLPEPIQLYPGDEFATRCIYNTMNKNEVTTGGEGTRNEMCLHMFTYYPRVDTVSICQSFIYLESWKNFLNNSAVSESNLQAYVENITWTANLATAWQEFFNDAAHITYYGRSSNLNYTFFPQLPKYVDLVEGSCTTHGLPSNATVQCGGGITNGNCTANGASSNTTVQCGGGIISGNFASRGTFLPEVLFLSFIIPILINI